MSRSSIPVLELKAVDKRFGSSEIIRGASLQLHQGERMALIGPNGAGKSTLFNLISGRIAPSAGDIFLNGSSIAGLPPHQISRRGLARSFQTTNIFDRLSVFENLRCAVLWPLGYRYAFWQRLRGLGEVQQRVDAVLQQIGLQQRRHCRAGELSYAEQRALELGITIAGGAGVLLLDEPTAGMSRSEADAAVELIRKVSAGKTLLLVEHDMEVVFGLADRIVVLVQGEIIACDTPAAIRANQVVQQAYLGASVLLPEQR
jgi:branched-chain amino acid transport system ATP-binding protein